MTATPKLLTFKGETLRIAAWTRKLGLPRNIIADRLRLGWSTESGIPVSVLNYRLQKAGWPIERALTEKPRTYAE